MYENQEQDVLRIKEAVDRAQLENAKNGPLQPDVNQRYIGDAAKVDPSCGEAPSRPYLTGTPQQVRYTRADMHEKAAASEQLAAQRNAAAAAFLRSYPQFETFLDLIRDGAITLY